MSGYIKVLGPSRNRLFIDNNEIDISDKTVNLKRASISSVETVNEGHGLFGVTCVEYHNKLHFFGNKLSGVENYAPGHHVTWNGESWDYNASIIPFEGKHKICFNWTKAVVYNDEIHLLGCCLDNDKCATLRSDKGNNIYHYKYSDTNGWKKVGKMPYNAWGSDAIVYRNAIELFGGNASKAYKRYHRVFDTKWHNAEGSDVKKLGFDFYNLSCGTWSKLAVTNDQRIYERLPNPGNMDDSIFIGCYYQDEVKEFNYVKNFKVYVDSKTTGSAPYILRTFGLNNTEPVHMFTTPAGELLIVDRKDEETPYINIKRMTNVNPNPFVSEISFELIVSILADNVDTNTVFVYFKDTMHIISSNKRSSVKETYELEFT